MSTAVPAPGKKESYELTVSQRKKIKILVIDEEQDTRGTLRSLAQRLGFGSVFAVSDHYSGLKKFESCSFSHTIFQARGSKMPAKKFLLDIMQMNDKVIAIPSSYEPTLDDVFDLLVEGAQGYLVKPFTMESLEATLLVASTGEPLPDFLLHAKDRNQALAAFAMTAHDNLAKLIRQSTQFSTAQRELAIAHKKFRHAVDLGKTFAKGGHDALLEAYIDFCISRSDGPATKLGRLRKRCEILRGKRERGEDILSNPKTKEAEETDDADLSEENTDPNQVSED